MQDDEKTTPENEGQEPPKETEEPEEPYEALLAATQTILERLDSLFETVNQLAIFVGAAYKKSHNEMQEQATKLSALVGKGAGEKKISGNYDELNRIFKDFTKKARAYSKARIANRIVAPSILVSMISQYDVFTSELIKALFLLRPEKLKVIKKQIGLAELESFQQLDEAKNFLLNTQIDELLRESHLKQLNWIGDTFDFAVDEKDELVQAYVEITARRNLFVHADGVVSNDYLKQCGNLSVPDKGATLGEQMRVNRAYMDRAHATLYLMAVKTSQIAWRKLRQDQLAEQDQALEAITFSLLEDGRYGLARRLYDFASELRSVTDDSTKRRYCINRAIAYKFSGQAQEANNILAKYDWSACAEAFKLAVAILKDEIDEAIKLVPLVPTSGDSPIPKNAYKEWPLFREIKQNPEFRTAYEKKFNEPWFSDKQVKEEATKALEQSAQDPTD